MKKHLLFVVGVLVLSLLACSLGGTQTQEPPQASNILFQDDFSSESSGWEVGDYDTGAVGYSSGYYFVSSLQSGEIMWGLAGQDFRDVVIDIEATQIQAPANDNNAYGAGCRFSSGENPDGYLFRISGDGYYSIHKVISGETTALVDWTESSAVRQGDAVNRMRIICNGTNLVLQVNGQEVANTSDSTFTSGDITVIATTYEDEMTEIHFDNIVVSKP